MQSYQDIPDTTTLTASRPLLLNNILTALSQSSGTTFPTTNLQVGMPCFRTDLNKLYILKDATPTWALLWDFSTGTGSINTLQYVSAKQLAASTDLNTVTTAGFYDGSALTNAPTAVSTDWFYIVVQRHSNSATWVSQTAYDLNGANPNQVWQRWCVSGTWGGWQKVWNAGNDGSGSGLDADTIDGFQSSQTATANSVVVRDSSGNIAGNILGNAATATTAATALNSAAIVDGAVSTAAKIADGVVTLAKHAAMATAKLLGRSTAGSGAPEEIAIGSGLSLSAGILSCTVTAPVTSVGGNVGAVTNAQIAASATAGYGYTPANPAQVVGIDSNFGVGSLAFGTSGTWDGANFTAVTCAQGATTTSFLAASIGANIVSFGTAKTGTWRNLGAVSVTGGFTPMCSIYQRIA